MEHLSAPRLPLMPINSPGLLVSLHPPPHAHAAHIGVEIEERPDAERLGHDVAEWRPL